jgi:hypothetical protein
MNLEALKGIIGIPSRKYNYTCPTCNEPFKTIYIKQIYCMAPCKSRAVKVEAAMKRAEELAIRKEMQKKKRNGNAEDLHNLNNKWLSRKL